MSHTNQTTPFCILPNRIADTAVNMADDMALLELFPEADAIRFRHYEWTHASWTFGYSIPFAQMQAIVGKTNQYYCRRPTGGGIVLHELDWTYSLVIPSSHPFSATEAGQVYQSIHEVLMEALKQNGCDTILAPCNNHHCGQDGMMEVRKSVSMRCFDFVEPNDLVMTYSKHKVAGIALKRTKQGLLAQGSVNKLVTGPLPWGNLQESFTEGLAKLLNAHTKQVSWPAYQITELYRLREQMASAAWNEKI